MISTFLPTSTFVLVSILAAAPKTGPIFPISDTPDSIEGSFFRSDTPTASDTPAASDTDGEGGNQMLQKADVAPGTGTVQAAEEISDMVIVARNYALMDTVIATLRVPNAPESSPLPKNDKPVFTPGVQTWTRGQGRFNKDFGYNEHSQNVGKILLRTRLQARVTWGPVQAIAQVQDSRVWGFESSTAAAEANTDLHQGYMQLGGSKGKKLSGWIRLGRQEISYGNQRLIGSLGWLPAARSFDALRMHGEYNKFSVDVFGALLMPMGVVTREIPNPADPTTSITESARSIGTELVGGTATGNFHKALSVELIALGQREGGKNGNVHFDRRIGNVGARLFGNPVAGLRYDIEFNYQWGKNNHREHSAWAGAATVGYVYGKKDWRPGGHVTYAIASGDDCVFSAGNNEHCKSQEFYNFYPTNHMHYGLVDLIGWRNVRDLELGAELSFNNVLKIKADYHFLQLHESEGRWSNAGGKTVGNEIEGNKKSNLGHEFNVVFVAKPWKSLMIQPGYGVFIADDVAKKMIAPEGSGDVLKPQHFAYLWFVATF